jgi:hypothetical protein
MAVRLRRGASSSWSTQRPRTMPSRGTSRSRSDNRPGAYRQSGRAERIRGTRSAPVCPVGQARGVDRVVIFGRGGSGKSTLARGLAHATQLPLIELDKEFWNDQLDALPRAQWAQRQHELASGDLWIMDGELGPYDAVEPRLCRADHAGTPRLLDVEDPMATGQPPSTAQRCRRFRSPSSDHHTSHPRRGRGMAGTRSRVIGART